MTPSTPTPTYTNLSPQKWLQLTHPPLLIDVRSSSEYAMFHAPRAVNFSLHRLLIGRIPGLLQWAWPAWFRDLPKDQPIALICLTAHRSPIAATQLSKAGFTQIFNITGGMMQWRQLRFETVSGSQPAPDTPAQGCVEEGSKA